MNDDINNILNNGAQDQQDNDTNDSCDCAIKIAELENNWKRALADYKNLEKRNSEEREQFVSFSNASLLLRILPVLDNLEMLDAHLNDSGLKLVIKEFKKTLNEEGVKEVEALNKDFDTNSMEAIEMLEVEDDSKAGKVVEVLSNGYLLKQKLLRPARVKVGQKKEK